MRWPEYRAHQAFIAPARNRESVWLFLIGLLAIVAALIALNQLYFDALYAWSGDQSMALYEDILAGRTAFAMYVQLFSFACMTLAVGLVVRLLHRRPARSLLGPMRPCIGQFGAVCIMLLVLTAVLFALPPWDIGGDYIANMALSRWVVQLPLSLLAVLVQVSAEELLFRGYIQQQLAARFRSPLVWMILPAGLFALGHYLPAAAGENAVVIAIWAGVFGILMADLTARSGTLGPAIALHFVNNVSAMLIVSLPDDLSGLALFVTPFSLADTEAVRAWLPVDFALMLVFWLAARLAIRR